MRNLGFNKKGSLFGEPLYNIVETDNYPSLQILCFIVLQTS